MNSYSVIKYSNENCLDKRVNSRDKSLFSSEVLIKKFNKIDLKEDNFTRNKFSENNDKSEELFLVNNSKDNFLSIKNKFDQIKKSIRKTKGKKLDLINRNKTNE